MAVFFGIALVIMLTIFIILDGADFGAGIVHLFIARDEKDRNSILKAIGPFWDGNEVWLIAAGGVMFFAFPKLYASVFSGFYLPLIIVLWLLIFRAIGLEFRNLVNNKLWETIWDKSFGIASLLLALFFGAALGNVVRGVNLGGVVDGVSKFESLYFFNPLWNEYFSPLVANKGILDWFTIILGVIAIVTLTIHGAAWIVLKTNSSINGKLKNVIFKLSILLIPLIIISILAWLWVKPNAMSNYFEYPVLWVFPMTVLIGLTGLFRANNFKKDSSAFIFSSVFIVGAFGSTVASLFPVLLPSSNSLNPSLTIFNASTSEYGLNVGIIWWTFAIILVLGYFYYVHHVFKGKVDDIEYH